jgi:thiol-disulfide isomerase/thioredoxin
MQLPTKCMKMFSIFMILSVLHVSLAAQSYNIENVSSASLFKGTVATEFKPLVVGDKVPDIEFSMVNFSSKKAKLSDFRGKWVLLDFWATWCSACLARFHKLDSIQKEYKKELQVLLVNCKQTDDREPGIIAFFKKWKSKYIADFSLPSAMEDSIAQSYFIHKEMPHYVWINPEGNVYAITSSQHITRENINALLKGESLQLPVKIDFNEKKNLYPGNDSLIHAASLFSWFFKGKIEGAGSINSVRQTGGVTRGLAMRNISILDMYKRIFELNGAVLPGDKKMIIECKDPAKLEQIATFDFIIPESNHQVLYDCLLAELNKYSDLVGRIEVRPIKCLKLIRTSANDKVKAQGGKDEDRIIDGNIREMKNQPFSHIIGIIDGMEGIGRPVIDATDFKHNVDITLPNSFENLIELKTILNRYDLDLVEFDEPLPVFVISDNQ